MSFENTTPDSRVVQSVERRTVNPYVVSSSLTAGAKFIWPVGQVVKTPPFHGGIMGSNPVPVTTFGRLAQLGERLPYKQNVSGSIPLAPTMQIMHSVKAECFLFYIQCSMSTNVAAMSAVRSRGKALHKCISS